jgi:DNA repair protein RadC
MSIHLIESGLAGVRASAERLASRPQVAQCHNFSKLEELATMNAVFETRWAKVGEVTEHYRTKKISGAQEAIKFAESVLKPYFEDKRDQEEMLVVTLDTKHRPIRITRTTRGVLDASLVHPREVFRIAVADCAAAIILAHNHPSGDSQPSPQDLSTTSRIVEAGQLMGIPLLDHLIVGDTVVSLALRGFM